MKHNVFFVIVFVLFIFSQCKSQEKEIVKNCQTNDSLFENPQYGNGVSSLQEFISSNVFPILSECRDSADLSYKVSYIYLEISEFGKVESVYLARFEYLNKCKDEVVTAFLNMGSWIPAKCNGHPIKSKRLIKMEY